METRLLIRTRFVFFSFIFFVLMSLVLVTVAHAAGPVISFAPVVSYNVGTTPYAVAVGDFNRDGYPDLVTANFTNGSPGTASVLINKGTGIFNLRVNYPAGSAPWGVAAGDFNGDGYDDFAVTNNGSGTVSVFINDGAGIFAAAVNYPVGAGLRGITSGDFNNDSLLDLVVTNGDDNTVSVLLGNGDGVFDPQPPVPTGDLTTPTGIASGDFDNDGLLDVVTANNSLTAGSISVLLGDGNGSFGTFTPVAAPLGTRGVTVGYFNADTYLDVATANTGLVSIFLNNGSGGFPTRTDIEEFDLTDVRGIITADFNLDGMLDLAVVFGSNNLALLAGNGDGTFEDPVEATKFHTLNTPIFLAAADFDGNGKPDVATADSGANKTSVFLNNTRVPVAALQIRKMAVPSSVESGQPVTYTLRYVNAGDLPALNVVITDIIPITVTNTSFTSNPNVTELGANRYAWTIGTMISNTRGVITVTGTLSGSLAIGGIIINTAQITTTSTESVTTDNQSTAIVTVACPKIYTVINTHDSGAGSLRQGLIDVCRGGTIIFHASVQPAINVASELIVTKKVTILGPGASTLAISGQSSQRVFQINPAVKVTISGLTIRDGSVTGDRGGGIHNQGELTLFACRVYRNTADSGGGIYNDTDAVLMIRGSTLDGNLATSPVDNDSGGGALTNLGQVTAFTSTFSNNVARILFSGFYPLTTGGGAVFNNNSPDATFTATSTVFSNNSALYGGAIWNYGGTIGVISSTFTTNQADPAFGGQGGAINNSEIATVVASTFGQNHAQYGGAIENYGVTLDIINSTFISNTSIGNMSNGNTSDGGALEISDGVLSLQNSTFTANDATGTNATGGTLLLIGDPPTYPHAVKNTIIAGSVASPACDLAGGSFDEDASANNLADEDSCGGDFAVSNKILLGPLGDYGGGTGSLPLLTVPLLPGSVALDSGAACAPTDQRGVTRPQSAACDIGAFESRGFQLAVRSGNGQVTPINTLFIVPLGVTVTNNYNEPVNGGLVTFVAPDPAIGPSATLAPSSTVTVAAGIAAVNATANALSGVYNVTASTLGAAPVAFSLSNNSRGTATTLTTLAVTPSSATYGQAIALTATVILSPLVVGMLPAGTVTFNDGNTPLAAPVVIDAAGHATFSTASLAAGLHNLTAEFAGDTGFDASVSSNLPYTVSKAATTSAVTSSPQPTAFGQQTIFTAMVTTPAQGATPPTGSVSFFDNGAPLGSGVLSAAGTATLAYSTLSAGVHTNITAQYSGDVNYATSTSPAYTHTVNKSSIAVAITSQPNPSAFGELVTFTATVTVLPPGAGTPAGTVTFKDGTSELGTRDLASGLAIFTKADLAIGAHSITAHYSGDAIFEGSVSSPSIQLVDKYGSQTVLTLTPNPSPVGQNVRLAATVSANQIAAAAGIDALPSGTVLFVDENGSALGEPPLVGGVATLDKANWPAGVFPVRAIYHGDATYAGSMSPEMSQRVDAPPTAVNDAAGALEGTPVQIAVLNNDADPAANGLIVVAVGAPSAGTVVIDSGDKTVTYTPNAVFHGSDSFTYTAQDVYGRTDTATVTVIVSAKSVTDAAPQVAPVNPAAPATVVFTSSNVQVTVDLPAGAYPDPLGPKDLFYLVFTPIITPTEHASQPPSGFVFAGFQFTLEAYLNNQHLDNFVFAQPVQVTFAYSLASLGDVREETLMPYFWNGNAWSMDGITVLARDLDNHTLTMQLTHLSEFGLFAEPTSGQSTKLYMPFAPLRGKGGGWLPDAKNLTFLPYLPRR